MPSPKGDLTLLCEALQSSSSLLGFAKVLPGKNALVAAGNPPRIVIFPVGGKNGTPDDVRASVASAWMLCTAHFWAAPSKQDPGGNNNAFDLRTRWFQAMAAQRDADPPGYFWKSPDSEDERWDIVPDTAEQGQEFEIDFLIRIDANKPIGGSGTVTAVSLNRVATLASDIGTADTSITVDATFEYPIPGVLHIDDEQIAYTGVSGGNTFTGAIRAVNGTQATTHAASASVYVSPT